jgi:hypothetical protein
LKGELVLFGNRSKDPKVMIRLGMLALALSIAWPRLITPSRGFSEGFVDGVKGAFLGMALALLIWGAKLGGFNRRPNGK